MRCYSVVFRASLGVFLLSTCDAASVGSTQQELKAELVTRRVWHAPAGGDGAPRFRVMRPQPDGTLMSATHRPAVSFVQWQGDVVFVDSEHQLWLGQQLLADECYGAPVVSQDESMLAYVRAAGIVAELHIRTSDGGDRIVNHPLYHLGQLRFAPDDSALLGIGAINGGIAGLHVVDLEGEHRCLTNCDLRAGEDWTSRHVPLPHGTAALRFDSELVYWNEHKARWRGRP